MACDHVPIVVETSLRPWFYLNLIVLAIHSKCLKKMPLWQCFSLARRNPIVVAISLRPCLGARLRSNLKASIPITEISGLIMIWTNCLFFFFFFFYAIFSHCTKLKAGFLKLKWWLVVLRMFRLVMVLSSYLFMLCSLLIQWTVVESYQVFSLLLFVIYFSLSSPCSLFLLLPHVAMVNEYKVIVHDIILQTWFVW